MGDVFVQGIALFGMVLLAALFAVEARRWRAIDSIIGRRQRIIRVWLVVLIEIMLAMMVVGPWIPTHRNPIAFVIYWAFCLMVALAVVVLALLDLKEVTRSYARTNRSLFEDLANCDEEDK